MHSYRVLKSTAVNLGASFCFTIGARYNVSSLSDDDKLPIPMYHYTDWTDFLLHSPIPSPIVAAEFGGISLCDYSHPNRCSYLIGSEEFGIDAHILEYCTSRVTLPARRAESFSISAVAPPLLTDRTMKQHTGKTMKRRRAD